MNGDICKHCHMCQKHCSFLEKYGIDIGDTVRLKSLAYHCFMCGNCTVICPSGIDGKSVLLDMRQKIVAENQGKCSEKGYAALLTEKQNYLFRNKRHMDGKSILFPGCNFPSLYPVTTKTLIELLQRKAGMGVLFDCCGKPVAELGLAEQGEAIIRRLNGLLRESGAEEAVMLCPNCYDYLKDRLEVKVISIYEKLYQLGIGQQVKGDVSLFLPCPDRKERQWLSFLAPFLTKNPEVIEAVQCCGLGGGAAVQEPELAADMAHQIAEHGHEYIYTYCASCAGNLTRNGCARAHHFLPEILQTGEWPDISKSMLNRIKTKFW